MLKGLNYYKDNIEKYRTSLQKRGLDLGIIDQIEQLRKERSDIVPQLESKRRELNEANPKGVPDEATRQKLKEISGQIKEFESKAETVEAELDGLLQKLPNTISDTSPEGGEDNFKELRRWGEIPQIENPLDHEQLGKKLDLIDFEKGTVVSGSKF